MISNNNEDNDPQAIEYSYWEHRRHEDLDNYNAIYKRESYKVFKRDFIKHAQDLVGKNYSLEGWAGDTHIQLNGLSLKERNRLELLDLGNAIPFNTYPGYLDTILKNLLLTINYKDAEEHDPSPYAPLLEKAGKHPMKCLGYRIASYVSRYSHFNWNDNIIETLIWTARNAIYSCNTNLYHQNWLVREDYNSLTWPNLEGEEQENETALERVINTERGAAILSLNKLITEHPSKYSYLEKELQSIHKEQSGLELMRVLFKYINSS
jgi:hypothetical protein